MRCAWASATKKSTIRAGAIDILEGWVKLSTRSRKRPRQLPPRPRRENKGALELAFANTLTLLNHFGAAGRALAATLDGAHSIFRFHSNTENVSDNEPNTRSWPFLDDS